ncbi:MAG: hypothetical protein WD027_08430 [Gaiellales bacterium]
MNSTADQLVGDYVKRLRRELAGLPRERRRELEQEISEHIAEGRVTLSAQNEAEIRTLLDHIGEPAEIAAEARERFGVQAKKSGWKEVGALVLLPIGGVILPVLGWFIGVALLWISDAWSTRDKLIGTLVVPGGLLLPLSLGVFGTGASGCSTVVGTECPPDSGGSVAWQIALLVVLFVVPLVTTVYLAQRRRPVAAAA